MTPTLDDIAARLAAGQPLSDTDAEVLAGTFDIVSLGMMADERRRQRHGVRTTFLRVASVPLPGAAGSAPTPPPAARELRLEGAFTSLDAARTAVRAAVQAAAVPISAFSLADIEKACDRDLARLAEWLHALHDDGLAFVSEAPIDQVGSAAVRVAAEAGVPVERLTVDAHVDGSVLATLRRARTCAGTGLVQVVAPVPRSRRTEPTTGYEDVKAVALSRLLLDVPHVQVDWTLHGPKLAQAVLGFGADDVDNVSALEEGVEGRRRSPIEEIRRNIRAAALEPVERDARFNAIG
jgi:hypothetical protein